MWKLKTSFHQRNQRKCLLWDMERSITEIWIFLRIAKFEKILQTLQLLSVGKFIRDKVFLEVRSSKEQKILASQSRETNRTGRKSSIQGQPALWTRHKKARVAPYVQLTSGGDWRASTSPSAGASLLYAVSPLARWYALYFVKVYFLQIKICNYLYYIYKRRLRAREDENKFINERLSSMALV